MHSPARNQKLSHATSHPLNKLFISGTLPEADRMPQNFKFKIDVFHLALCFTPCGIVREDISKVVSGQPEAQARGDVPSGRQEGENDRGDGKGRCYRN